MFLPILIFAQEDKFNEKLNIKEIFNSHKVSSKQLSRSRGMPPPLEFKENNINDFLRNRKKNTAILVYTFINDSLQILIIGKNYKFYKDVNKTYRSINQSENRYKNYHIIKVNYLESELINDINQLNYFFASQHSNKIFSKRGSIAKSTTINKTQFKNIYSRISNNLLPKQLQLDDIEHLIIVPTSNIGTLPFSALKVNDNYLIDKMSYSIAPSLSSIANETKSIKNGFKNALFISNPNFAKENKWNFNQLPGTEREVNNITSKIDKNSYRVLNGSHATKKNVLQAFEDYELLYFATHGFSDSSNSLDNSFIALSGKKPSQAFITPREIQHKKLKAKLVVLSACQTGLGVPHKGGVIGLTRAFQLAGVDHVLMSLWSINDEETATIMSMFFTQYLNDKKFISPHEALRKAIIKYKSEISSDPKYWAAFSVFGIPYSNEYIDIKIKVFIDERRKTQEYNNLEKSLIDKYGRIEIIDDEILSDFVVSKKDNQYFLSLNSKAKFDNNTNVPNQFSNIEGLRKAIETYASGIFKKN